MSLARTLMNGSIGSNTIDTSGYVYENVDIDDNMWLDHACESLVEDIYKVDKAYHVADIMGEVKVIKEGLDQEDCATILEGVIKSAIDKLIESFKKLWAKLKAWFQSVIKFFKSFLLKGKKFVNEFGKELKEKYSKNKKGFTYTGCNYTLDAGDRLVEKAFNTISDNIKTCAADMDDYSQITRDTINSGLDDDDKNNLKKYDPDTDDTELKYSNYGFKSTSTSLADVTTELDEAYRNGNTTPSDIDDFADASVPEMLDMIGGKADKAIRNAEQKQNATENQINSLIKALNKIKEDETKKNENGGDVVYKSAKKQSRAASLLINLSKTVTAAQVKAWKEACTTYQSVLGAFYRWKPAKEGFDFEDDDMDDVDEACGGKKKSSIEGCGSKKGCSTEGCNEATSIFEAAMQLL